MNPRLDEFVGKVQIERLSPVYVSDCCQLWPAALCCNLHKMAAFMSHLPRIRQIKIDFELARVKTTPTGK
jgi:hypothetical protein